MRILLIDDERNIARMLSTALETDGHEAVAVESSSGALRQMQKAAFDAAFLDLRLEKEDGMKVLAQLRQVDPGLVIVIITAFASIPNAVEATRLGAADYLPKPFTPDEMRLVLARMRLYRQTTSDELVHARQATEIVFAALLDPIVIFSAGGEIAYQNPAAETLRKKLAGSEAALPIFPLAKKVLNGGGDYLPESLDQSICVRVDDREKFLLPRVIGLCGGGRHPARRDPLPAARRCENQPRGDGEPRIEDTAYQHTHGRVSPAGGAHWRVEPQADGTAHRLAR